LPTVGAEILSMVGEDVWSTSLVNTNEVLSFL
jgi:hypothetical protein